MIRNDERGREGRELLSLVSTWFLMQESDLSSKTLVDSGNGFNKLRSLAMLWTVHNRWLSGAHLMIS